MDTPQGAATEYGMYLVYQGDIERLTDENRLPRGYRESWESCTAFRELWSTYEKLVQCAHEANPEANEILTRDDLVAYDCAPEHEGYEATVELAYLAYERASAGLTLPAADDLVPYIRAVDKIIARTRRLPHALPDDFPTTQAAAVFALGVLALEKRLPRIASLDKPQSKQPIDLNLAPFGLVEEP